METAKEELQSTNEELTTVNEQLQTRNLELNELNNDLTNLLASMAIPMVMVGPDLRIRRYTEAACRAINLRANDIGRPLSDLKTNIDIADLDDLIREVINQVQVREREVRDADGRWHRLRIHPYRTADHKIEGAVILLIDIDDIKKSAEAIRESEARFRLLAESAPVIDLAQGRWTAMSSSTKPSGNLSAPAAKPNCTAKSGPVTSIPRIMNAFVKSYADVDEPAHSVRSLLPHAPP